MEDNRRMSTIAHSLQPINCANGQSGPVRYLTEISGGKNTVLGRSCIGISPKDSQCTQTHSTKQEIKGWTANKPWHTGCVLTVIWWVMLPSFNFLVFAVWPIVLCKKPHRSAEPGGQWPSNFEVIISPSSGWWRTVYVHPEKNVIWLTLHLSYPSCYGH